MTEHYKLTRRVEFRDTDMAGIAHFSVFFVFMEQAEHELLRHLGLSVMLADDQGPISFPRVAARCDYQRAVKFEDLLDIEVAIVGLGEKSVTYEFNFSHQGHPVATGQITTVCCSFQPGRSPSRVGSPKNWRLLPSSKLVVPCRRCVDSLQLPRDGFRAVACDLGQDVK